jgi:molybdopterin synthase catalytic subunit
MTWRLGGLTLFVGRVRDHDGGQGVTSLDYSAHPSALQRLQDVCARIAGAHEVHGWRR